MTETLLTDANIRALAARHAAGAHAARAAVRSQTAACRRREATAKLVLLALMRALASDDRELRSAAIEYLAAVASEGAAEHEAQAREQAYEALGRAAVAEEAARRERELREAARDDAEA